MSLSTSALAPYDQDMSPVDRSVSDPASISKLAAMPSPLPPPSKPSRSIGQRLDHACLNLTPSFFTLNMGTGITSILLYNFPYPAAWLRILGTVIFVLNILVFLLLIAGNLGRYTRYKGLFTATMAHPVAGMFWGALPMGFATIVVRCFSIPAGSTADQ